MTRSGDAAEARRTGLERAALRDRTVRWAAALLAVFTVAATAACAGPPSKGPIRGVSLNQSRNNVVILAREPNGNMSAEQLVLGFLQALTGDQKDPTFSVAQEYLTNDARAAWIPAGTTLVTQTRIVDYVLATGDPGQSAATPDGQTAAAGSGTPTSGPPAVGEIRTVSASGHEYATIDENGFFQYTSASVTQPFTLKFFGGTTGWRITEKPDFRMVSPEAFKRAYQMYQSPLPVYLPSHGAQVPHIDQVYLTQAPGKVDSTYDALARAVLHGRYPWQRTHLELQSPVTIDAGGVAMVRLQPPPAGMNIADVQRALFQTFRDASETPQLVSPTPVSEVQITYDGCAPTQCQAMGLSQESPVQPNVYWLCPQGQDAAIVSRTVPGAQGGSPVCPQNGGKVASEVTLSGVRLAKNAPIAVKQSTDGDLKTPAGTTTVAAVEENGAVIVAGNKSTDQTVWYTAADASKVTDLEWDPVDGSLWVVDAGSLYRVRDAGSKGSGSATPESVPVPVPVPSSTSANQQITRFKPSPDGLRAVAVGAQKAGDSGAADTALPASMVIVNRNGGEPFLAADTQLLAGSSQTADYPLVPGVTATDAAWADGRSLVLLGTVAGSNTPKLYKVYLDGTQDSTIADPLDAQPGALHVTAAIGTSSGHPALWTVSDAPGANGVTTTYFKPSGGGSDSFTEIGSSPVVATTVAG